MSVAGLYRYYDGRDALFTELIADAFEDLATAVAGRAGVADPTPDRLLAAASGYRDWSLSNPNRFMLIFGSPVPGYSAPEAGPTVDAAFSLGLAWWAIIRAGVMDATLDLAAWEGDRPRPDDGSADRIEASDAEVRAVNAIWALVHGLVVLEMQDHFSWAIADTEGFFIGEVERWLDQLTTKSGRGTGAR